MSTAMTTEDKLIYMANQIDDFFATQGEARAVPGIASHINQFWTPRMRAQFLEHVAKDDSGLKPYARKAVALIPMPQKRPA